MKSYIIYDRTTNKIVSKFRLMDRDTCEKEDTRECSKEEILDFYRGGRDKSNLEVFLVNNLENRSSKEYTSYFDENSQSIVYEKRS